MRASLKNVFILGSVLALGGCASPAGGDGGSAGESSGGQPSGGSGGQATAGQPTFGGSQSSGGSGGGNTSGSGGSPSSAGTGMVGPGGAGATGGAGGPGAAGSNPTGGGPQGGAPQGGTGGTTTGPSGGTGGTVSTGGTAGSGGSGGFVPNGPRPACTPPPNYRNLFAELLGKTEAEIDEKLNAGFQSLFHGGQDKTVYYTFGSDEAYIHDVNNNDVRSEGISYGMTIAVQLDKKEEFNRLWKFAKQHMEQGGGNAGLFHWRTNTQGQVTGNGSAPDGEEYFATALIFASKRWGDGSGIYAYSNEARTVLDAMANKGLFNRSNHLVLFTPNGSYTDPSYMLPAFYEVWACFDTKNQAFWKNAITAARTFLQRTTHPTTGLAPYLANFDGSPSNALDGGSTFQSDSWRVVGNIMMDHHLFNADPWQVEFAKKYAAFFKMVYSMSPVPDEFQLNGTPVHSNPDPAKALAAQNALVAFGVSAEEGRPFVQRLWDMEIPTGQYRYYDGMLYLLSFLHVAGRFHLWY